jgi:hypothetical protein
MDRWTALRSELYFLFLREVGVFSDGAATANGVLISRSF